MWGALGRRSFAKLTLCIVLWVVSFLPLLAFCRCSTAVSNVDGGRRTMGMTAVNSTADGRRTMSVIL